MKTSSLCILVAAALLAACETTGGGGSGSRSAGATGSNGSAGSASAEASSTGASASVSAGAAAAGASGSGATTPAERRADLDSQLDASLGRFDEQLRREQQRTASERDSHAAARANEAVVDATANSDERREKDRDDIRRDRSGDLQSAGVDAASTAAGGMAGTGADAKPIPSGADDDIVARRLRRAAETETDPELKEKLWKEYIDYKQNTKGSK